MGMALVAKIAGRCFLLETIRPVLTLQSLVNCHPGAAVCTVNFAVAILHAAAGSVKQALGADRNRTDTAGIVQAAVPAQTATLFKLAKASDIAEKLGICAGYDLLVRGLGHGLYSGSTRQHQQEIGLVHLFFAGPQVATRAEHVAGLVDDDCAGDFLAGRRQLLLHPEDLFLAAGFADRGTLGTSDDEDFSPPFQGGEYVVQRLLGRYDHDGTYNS